MGFGGVVCFTYVPWRKMVLVHFLVPQEVPWTEESESRSCSKIMSTLHFAVNCVDYKWLIATFWWGPGVTAEVNKDSKEFEWQRRATQMRRNQGREDSAGWLLPRRRKSARYWRAYGCAHDTLDKFISLFGVCFLPLRKRETWPQISEGTRRVPGNLCGRSPNPRHQEKIFHCRFLIQNQKLLHRFLHSFYIYNSCNTPCVTK